MGAITQELGGGQSGLPHAEHGPSQPAPTDPPQGMAEPCSHGDSTSGKACARKAGNHFRRKRREQRVRRSRVHEGQMMMMMRMMSSMEEQISTLQLVEDPMTLPEGTAVRGKETTLEQGRSMWRKEQQRGTRVYSLTIATIFPYPALSVQGM